MFCQSCGAENTEGARFCNMCGTPIAAPGTPGGPIAEEAPEAGADRPAEAPAPAVEGGAPVDVWAGHEGGAPGGDRTPSMARTAAPAGGGPSMSSVSLQSIGVQSSGRTWAVILVVALVLVGLGAGATYVLMRGDEGEVVAEAGPEGDGTSIEVGTPIPEGMEPPDVDFVSGGVRVRDPGTAADPRQEQATDPTDVRDRGGSASDVGGGGADRGGREGGSQGASQAERGGGGRPTGGGSGGSGARAGAGGSGGSGGGASGGGGSGTGAGSADRGGAGGSGAGSGGGGGAPTGDTGGSAGEGGTDTVPEGEMPEERDIALEMYAAQVRFVIRRYYASRAQSCFDRATRNQPDLRGTVVVRFTIGDDGQVRSPSVVRNTTGNSDLGACLAGQVGSWQLPAPPGGELELEMPFSN